MTHDDDYYEQRIGKPGRLIDAHPIKTKRSGMTKRELINALEQFDVGDNIEVFIEVDPMRRASNTYVISRVVRISETYGDSADSSYTVERLAIR